MNKDNKPETKTQALFDTKQAAKFLGVSVRTLKRWQKSGKLVPEKKGDNGRRGGRGKGDKYSLEQLKRVTADGKRVTSTVQNVTADEKRVSSTDQNGTSSESFALIPISTDGRKALVRVVNNLKKSGNSIEYIDAESKNITQSAVFIQPETFYSPKDKVSYAIWNKEIKADI